MRRPLLLPAVLLPTVVVDPVALRRLRPTAEWLGRHAAADPHHDLDHDHDHHTRQPARFYEVKPGDNLAVIARSFDVSRPQIAELNNLADGGETLQIGQILEIPTDVVLIESLPTEPPSSTSEP